MSHSTDKVSFDAVLGQQLKEIRIDYNIKANDISLMIERSAAYISILEKGKLKNISKSELTEILNYITSSPYGMDYFVEEVVNKHDFSYLQNSALVLNYDWVERKITIPTEYYTNINKLIKKLNIPVPELVTYINSNEDYSDIITIESFSKTKKTIYNAWTFPQSKSNGNYQEKFILVNITYDLIDKILNKSISETTYLDLYTILYHLYKLDAKTKKPYLEESDRRNLRDKTIATLHNCNIYTLIEKKEAAVKSKTSFNNVPFQSTDTPLPSSVQALEDQILQLRNKEHSYVDAKIDAITNNLANNNSFALAFMGLNLDAISDKSSKIKKDFLLAVQKLINYHGKLEDNSLEKF